MDIISRHFLHISAYFWCVYVPPASEGKLYGEECFMSSLQGTECVQLASAFYYAEN